MLVWFFFKSCGSNSPFRSRGTRTFTSPKLVRKHLAAMPVPAVVGVFVLVIILAGAKFVIHAACLQQLTDFCSALIFFGTAILSGHNKKPPMWCFYSTAHRKFTQNLGLAQKNSNSGAFSALRNHFHSTEANQFRLGNTFCRIRGSFDYLNYPYYPAYKVL